MDTSSGSRNNSSSSEPWRDLRVGDRVRIVRVPSYFSTPSNYYDEETLAVYRSLVAAGAVLTIAEIDEFGHPWTEPFDIADDGRITTESGIGHTLALNDDSWERVVTGD